ncbi:hypothetical protein SDRG_12514 [Saprolegnia diclina VS20]|uniref:Apple domain-containing protein n=1 Tax=Saprolegnia diclina (strain VS20) TaxID=1156394 RepID=T0RIQ1_SAPDV|nr:hypothetical protein SDRG_12514 [Saprolegnia diclina VS20]EQC29742.1 hypothetical protein SDRG_12514 [Saprolegnia diclina VS20]|eukprot:XP_008616808.1 hypothetical protein SDRG_12514 [Saprolegnia diclina VS20]
MLGQCCDACRSNSNCGAYTLAENVCYLKTAAGDRKPANGATSVSVFAVTAPPTPTTALPTPTPDPTGSTIRKCGNPEWNTDFSGSDLSDFQATGDFGAMLSQCCDACKKSAKCNAYTLAEGVCYLKTTAGNRKPTPGATSVAVTTIAS